MSQIEPLLTEKEAAQVLKTSPGTLRNWRSKGKGPPWVRLGDAIRYAPSALRDYIDVRTRRPCFTREVA